MIIYTKAQKMQMMRGLSQISDNFFTDSTGINPLLLMPLGKTPFGKFVEKENNVGN